MLVGSWKVSRLEGFCGNEGPRRCCAAIGVSTVKVWWRALAAYGDAYSSIRSSYEALTSCESVDSVGCVGMYGDLFWYCALEKSSV